MQTATLVISCLSLAVSATTLAVVLIGGKRIAFEANSVKMEVETKVSKLKNALAEL